MTWRYININPLIHLNLQTEITDNDRNIVKCTIEDIVKKFNDGFRNHNFQGQVAVFPCPFGGTGETIPISNKMRLRNPLATEFLDRYNKFIELNLKYLKKYSLMIIIINNREPVKFLATKVTIAEVNNPHVQKFKLVTHEKYIAEIMPLILTHEVLPSPVNYAIDLDQCSFYFETESDAEQWKWFLQQCSPCI